MRKTILGLAAAAAIAAPLVSVAPAEAAVDRRPCVSLAEYRAVHSPMTPAKVKGIFDINGVQIDAYYDGYWDYQYVEDGYWDSWYDEWSGEWYDEWVDTSYYEDVWVNQIDTVRSYKKCAGFDGGRGRVGINYDNYTSVYSGMRIYTKVRNNPSQLTDLYSWWRTAPDFSARSRSVQPEAPEGTKDRPHVEADRPSSQPLTPDPHPHGPEGAIPRH